MADSTLGPNAGGIVVLCVFAFLILWAAVKSMGVVHRIVVRGTVTRFDKFALAAWVCGVAAIAAMFVILWPR